MPLHHVERGQQLTDQRQDRPQQRAVPFLGRAPPMQHWKQTRNQPAVLRRKIERQKCVIRRPRSHLNRSASARVRISPPARRRYGSIALVSSGSGTGSAFGVTPSISRRPSGHTMCRSNTILTPSPPPDSSALSVWGKHFPSKLENALEFSTASLVRYPVSPSAPPALSPAWRMAALRSRVTRLSVPFGFPAGLPDTPGRNGVPPGRRLPFLSKRPVVAFAG